MNPDVLLFDEPTAALDPRTQQWLIELLVELHRAGKTIVLATHDLEPCPCWPTAASCSPRSTRSSATGTPDAVLGDEGLLVAVNLVRARSRS